MDHKSKASKGIKPDPDPTVNNKQQWTEPENRQLIDSINGQFNGAPYMSYRNAIPNIDWGTVNVEHRSEVECKSQCREIVKAITKNRSLGEMLMDAAGKMIEKLNAETQIPAEVVTIKSDVKKRKDETQTHQPQRTAETIENKAKKPKHGTQTHQPPSAAEGESIENVGRIQHKHQTHIRAADVETTGNGGKKGQPQGHSKPISNGKQSRAKDVETTGNGSKKGKPQGHHSKPIAKKKKSCEGGPNGFVVIEIDSD